ncbi:MAG: hypothetical protein ABL906_01260 [Sideroxydans sp.]
MIKRSKIIFGACVLILALLAIVLPLLAVAVAVVLVLAVLLIVAMEVLFGFVIYQFKRGGV